MDALKELLTHCKCGVFLTVNEHRNYYLTPEQQLGDYEARECSPEFSEEVRAGILKSGNIVEIQFYPTSPIGSYLIVDYDLDRAVQQALDCIKGE
jgi:hypothetical protein